MASYNQQVTVLVGLQHGDEGKGKISKALSDSSNYDCYVRFNGGPNAGHTIYIDGEKVVLHQIPCGILQNKQCLISSSCVVDMNKLNDEAQLLIDRGIDVYNLLHIAYNAHIITEDAISEDNRTNRIGTTGSGIGPTYSAKALRTGKRYNRLKKQPYKTVDPFTFLSSFENIFMEGAQGFELDIDHGNYPFVTSSSCISGAVFLNGITPNTPINVVGIAKLYDTYVGSACFQPVDGIFTTLQEIGGEFGATTGRARQCNWLNLDNLVKAIKINSVRHIYFNKCDIIEELNVFKLIHNDNEIEFSSIKEMKKYITSTITSECGLKYIVFSGNPNGI